MKQYLILILAVAFFSACGKKKEAVEQTQPVAPPTATPAPDPAAPDKAKLDAEKAEADRKAKETAKSADRERASKRDQKVAPKNVVKARPGKIVPKNVEKKIATQELQLTGGQSELGMIYTGSNADFIITQLLTDEKMKPIDVQNKNLKLAADIWEMAYLVDRSGQLSLDIEFKNGEGYSKIQAKTTYISSGIMRMITNPGTAAAVEITAECLDKSPMPNRCKNLLVTFSKDGAQTTAVLRQTLADIRFNWDDVKEPNEYATFFEFLNNARLDIESPNRIDLAYLHTFEIINGKSGFKAIVTGKKNQLIVLEADLLLKSDFSAPMIQVKKNTKMNEVDLWMARSPHKDLGLMRLISGAELIENNTKGEIKIRLTISSPSTDSKNVMDMRFKRISVPAEL